MHHNDSKQSGPRRRAATASAENWQKKRRSAITGALETFLRRANQRHLTNLALECLAVAGGIGAAGVILLLVVGRQVLDWYWPVFLFAVALLAGLYRARRRLLTNYRLAQVVDTRLGLDDRLSTLIYFRDAVPAADFTAVIERQAEARLRPEDMNRAMPVAFPKYGYLCAGLLVAAGGLVGIRYGVLRTMDLNPPLANIRFDPMQPEPKAYASTKKSAIQERWDQQLKELGLTAEDLEMPDEKGMKPSEIDVPAAANDPNASPLEKQDGVKNMKAPSPEAGENSEGGEKAEGETSDKQSGDSGSDPKGAPQKKPNEAPQNAKNGQQGSQDGLMNKMRDALANLMNKMKNPGQQDNQDTNQGSPQQQQSENAKQQQQQGTQSQGKQQGEGQPGADQQGDQQNGEKVAGDKSKAGEKSGDHPGDQNSKSGMGKQDGEKAIREAQQLAAMGKISEIFGKRAQQITGEMSVEVSSGKQQLKTQWSERKALHADTGAETNRNEIPLAYQSYIQRYFEEVRKTPGAKSKAPANP